MTNAIKCDSYEASGALDRYVAGTLDIDSAEALEDHFLTCERCQRSIAAGSVIRRTGARARPYRSRVPAWALTAVAASLTTILLVRTVQQTATRELGRVADAPLYAGTPVRSPSDTPSVLFDSAMTAYNRRDYRASTIMLTRLNDIAPNNPAVLFFLGAGQIMLDHASVAERSFSGVIAVGPSQYRGEAFYYRAKTLLQQDKRNEAVTDLRAAQAADPAVATQAAELLRRLEE